MPVDIEKRNKRQYQWQKENTDRINFTMPKGTKEEIKAAADRLGITPAEFIRQAINEKMQNVK
jgi:predicted DNA-binding protein